MPDGVGTCERRWALRLSLLSIGTVTVRLRTEACYWRAPVLHTITASLRTGGPLGYRCRRYCTSTIPLLEAVLEIRLSWVVEGR